jgi:hypothetical protein
VLFGFFGSNSYDVLFSSSTVSSLARRVYCNETSLSAAPWSVEASRCATGTPCNSFEDGSPALEAPVHALLLCKTRLVLLRFGVGSTSTASTTVTVPFMKQ